MHCLLCQLFSKETAATIERTPPLDQSRHFPEPVIYYPATGEHRTHERAGVGKGRGPAPGSRAPRLTDAIYDQRPGTPSPVGIKPYAGSVTRTAEIGGAYGTDDAPLTRSRVEAGHLRHVRLQYVQPGGPAMTAPNQYSWGWIHNYGYLTIGDTLKPAQQLPRYNTAAVDTQTVLDRARQSLLKTLYGG